MSARNGRSRHVAAFLAAALLLSATSINIPDACASPTVAWSAIERGDPQDLDAAPLFANNRTMVVDAAGNTYVTGSADAANEESILTIKYDSTGAIQWRALAAGRATSIAVDNSGNVFVTGMVQNGYLITLAHDDFQVLKYAPDGTELWRAAIPAPPGITGSANIASAAAVDASGNAYVTGAVYIYPSGAHFVLVKYDANGAEQWRVYPDQGPGRGVDVAVDKKQNVVVTGATLVVAKWVYLTVKYNPQGAEIWRATADNGPNYSQVPIGLGIDPSGSIAVAGTSSNGFFTVKYATTGQELWRAFAIGSDPYYNQLKAYAVATDSAGNTYVTGSGNLPTGLEYATIRYAPDGSESWRAFTNEPGDATAYSIAVDSAGAVYVTGEASDISFFIDNHYLTIRYDAASGSEIWRAVSTEGVNSDNSASAVRVDANGNAFVTGFTGETPFTDDFLTIKFSPAGSELWRASSGPPLPSPTRLDGPHAMTVDAQGNAYILGYNFRESQLGPAPEFLTVKVDPTGKELWRASFGLLAQMGGGIAVDSAGKVLTTFGDFLVKYDSTGSQQWSVNLTVGNGDGCADPPHSQLLVDTGSNVYVTCAGIREYLTFKYDSAGNNLWQATASAPFGIEPTTPAAIARDAAGNTYVTGTGVTGVQNAYVTVKYDSVGQEQWRATVLGDDLTGPSGLVVDAAGIVYVTGGGFNGALFREDFLTLKYDTNGNELWRAYGNFTGSHAAPFTLENRATALTVDPNGNVYVSGRAANGHDFDYATIKYNAAGIEQWRMIAEGGGNGDDQPSSIVSDNAGNVYVTGTSYNSNANFDSLTIKYDSAGFERWRTTANTPLNDDFGAAIALGSAGSVFVAGTSNPPGQAMGVLLQKIVQGAPTTTTLSSSGNPSTQGQTVTFSAVVAGTKPSGTVDFHDGASTICAGVALIRSRNSGTATCATVALTAGAHMITAVYSGDSANEDSASAPLTQTVQAPPPGVSLISSLNPSKQGVAVTFTAIVAGQAPTGTVTFKDKGSTLCVAVPLQGGGNSPAATCSTSTLAVGKHTITAAYSGDANNAPLTSKKLKQKVTK